jgi:hypothetical protein
MSWEKDSPHFKPEELLSPDGLALYAKGIYPLRLQAVLFLNKFRDALGVPLTINSGALKLRGFRSPKEHLKLVEAGVTPNTFSFHCQGIAFDVSSNIYKPTALAEKAKAYGWRGIVIYKTWVHLDLRNGDAYWGVHAN